MHLKSFYSSSGHYYFFWGGDAKECTIAQSKEVPGAHCPCSCQGSRLSAALLRAFFWGGGGVGESIASKRAN